MNAGGPEGYTLGNSYRASQAWQLSKFITRSARQGRYALVCGDFNFQSNELPYRVMRDFGQVKDAWIEFAQRRADARGLFDDGGRDGLVKRWDMVGKPLSSAELAIEDAGVTVDCEFSSTASFISTSTELCAPRRSTDQHLDVGQGHSPGGPANPRQAPRLHLPPPTYSAVKMFVLPLALASTLGRTRLRRVGGRNQGSRSRPGLLLLGSLWSEGQIRHRHVPGASTRALLQTLVGRVSNVKRRVRGVCQLRFVFHTVDKPRQRVWVAKRTHLEHS